MPQSGTDTVGIPAGTDASQANTLDQLNRACWPGQGTHTHTQAHRRVEGHEMKLICFIGLVSEQKREREKSSVANATVGFSRGPDWHLCSVTRKLPGYTHLHIYTYRQCSMLNFAYDKSSGSTMDSDSPDTHLLLSSSWHTVGNRKSRS